MPGPTQPSKNLNELQYKDIKISAININSITAPERLQELQHFVDANGISILALSEIKIDAEVHHSLYSLKGFHAPVLNFRTRRGGGVAIYIKSNIPFSHATDLENDGFETVWVRIKVKKETIVLCSCYLPPHASSEKQNEFLDYLTDSVSEAQKYMPDLIAVAGDFNAGNCWLPARAPRHSPVTPFETALKNTTETIALTQVINTATRIQNGIHNIRDLAFVDRTDLIKDVEVVPSFSNLDHLPLILTLSMQLHDNFPRPNIKIWDYSNTDIAGLIEALANTDWDYITNRDLDEAVDLLSTAVLRAADKYIPSKTIKIRNDKPWLTSELRREMRKRDRLFKQARSTDHAQAWDRWRSQRNLVTGLNRRLKREHLKLKINVLIENKKNPYKYHKILKSITGFRRDAVSAPLITDNNILNTDEQKAEAFNIYFCSQTNISVGNNHLKFLQKYKTDHIKTAHTLDFVPITPNEVLRTINKLDASKACGPDKLPAKLIKMSAAYIAEPLSKLLNKSVQEGRYPTQWKKATVKPIFKGKGSPSDPKSHRPISLLPCLSKIFEKLMFTRIYSHLNNHSLLTPKQSGYRPGHNTEIQLAYLTDRLYRSLDSENDYTIIYLDISRYFEKIWHEGLLAKCDVEFGIRGKHLEWLKSYLSDRQQVVQVGQAASNPRSLAAGVPQGSVLGPLLAVLYLNGLSNTTTNEMLFFADDSSLHASHNANNFEDAERTLQQDLDSIRCYGKDWIITFNATKTCQQTFSQKPMPRRPSLTFDGIAVPTSDSHTHLGITLSTDLRFKQHVNRTLLKFNRTLSPLYPISHMIPRNILLDIYKIYVQPHLDYCDTIYDSHLTTTDKSRLEKAQNRAARLITATPRRTSTVGLRDELGWTALELRRRRHRLQLYHKIVHDESVPDFIKEIIPNTRQSATGRLLRNTLHDQLDIPMTNKASFARSLIPMTTKLWNDLPHELRQEPNHNIFKKELNLLSNHINTNSYLSIGSKLGNMLHTQIRLNCSDLNEHKWKVGRTDTPKCFCGYRREDTEHFLLCCPQFNTERAEMFREASAALQRNFQSFPQKHKAKILLYGPSDGGDKTVCTTLANILQRFLQQTRRFAREPLLANRANSCKRRAK